MVHNIIAVVNQKGGTGKTTTSINLGCGLSKLGKKVLLIDLDPQANLTYALGIDLPNLSIADVFTGEANIQEILVKKEDLFVAPGATDLVDIDISLVNQGQREAFLKRSLKQVKGFDHIIIDAAPSLSLLTLNALNAAKEIIIPMQLEVLSLQGLKQILATITRVKQTLNPQLKVKGILPVMVDKRRNLSQELLDHLRENTKERIFNSMIHLNVKVAESPSFGKSVIGYSPSSIGAKDYMRFSKEFLGG